MRVRSTRPRRVLRAVAHTLAASAVVTSCGSSDGGGGDHTAHTAPTVHGSLTLIGGAGYTRQSPCHGFSTMGTLGPIDYSQVQGGTAVKILNSSGSIIGTGTLDPGQYLPGQADTSDGCRFNFDVRLDRSSKHYELILGSYEPYDFDDPASVDVTLGRGTPPE